MRTLTRATLCALAVGCASLLLLDGWFPLPGSVSTDRAPSSLARAFDAALSELSARAEEFGRRPEVVRSLAGGGIAVNRLALFAAARQALENAPAGSWIVLADPAGSVQTWAGDAPASLEGLVTAGECGLRWSATAVTASCRHPVGAGTVSGIVYAARDLPALAPDFARALGLSGGALAWRPVASRSPGRKIDFRPVADVGGEVSAWNGVAFALILGAGLFCLGRTGNPWRVGIGLALILAGLEADRVPGSRALASVPFWAAASGLLFLAPALTRLRSAERGRRAGVFSLVGAHALLAIALVAAFGIAPPELGMSIVGSLPTLLRLSGVLSLIAGGLALAASALTIEKPRGWMTAAILVTTTGLAGALAFVSPSPIHLAASVILSVIAFDVWSRAVAVAAVSKTFPGVGLFAGSVLLTLLVVSPVAEHLRASRSMEDARGIQLPDPAHPARRSVVGAERAAARAARFDLAVELPAPPEETDLSDLAYRLWRDRERESRVPVLLSYRVFDPAGTLRSNFSLLPDADASNAAGSGPVTIDRYDLAVVRRTAFLRNAGERWGRVEISAADWPAWDPLPPRIDVYRRLVLGEPSALWRGAWAPRPVLTSYARDGEPRDEGPALPLPLRDRLRKADTAISVHMSFRGEELWGEIRPTPEGYRLVAFPVPDFLGRLLTAALLLPALGLLGAAAGLLMAWHFLASPGSDRSRADLRIAKTFRGRLVALFVLGVMIPLAAVTVFLRSSIVTRSRQDTLDHARTALTTARRVLDGYVPSVRARLQAVDDPLLTWLSNAVGYDLSVYAPDSTLIATSRRDLYAAGLVPDRVPAPAFVAIGLGGASQFVGSRAVSGGGIDEITTNLASVPGVPGVRSSALLSILLLPQQRAAQAEAAQLVGAVAAFSLLVFLFSALVAGRLAVRVARPVADLVEATRAVARGDFSPRVAEPPDEELKELVRAFLSMSRSLQQETEALSAEKQRLATLLAHLTAGVVAYRGREEVLLANPAAAALGGGRADARRLDEVFPGEIMKEVRRVLADPEASSHPVEVQPRVGERWRVVSVALPLGEEGERMAVIEDVSDVVRSNRLSAWAEMARIIAHEIKNPLTPIRLSVEHLREVWRRGSPEFGRILDECVANVLRQTDELKRSASEFSDYARLPAPRTAETDIGQLVEESAAGYAGAAGVRWTVRVEPDLIALTDARLLGRVFSNLIGNAVEALSGRGGEIRLSARRTDDKIVLEVEDDGPGVAPEILPRLFDPYFSAKSGGTGLGLAIAKKIVEEHGGTISAENRATGGLRVSFDLPLVSTPVGGSV